MDSTKGTDPLQNIEDFAMILSHTSFPAQKIDILSESFREGRNINVITLIQTLPDKLYSNKKEVLRNIGLTLPN